MGSAEQELLAAFDGHDVERVRAALSAGADVRGPIDGKLATDWLLESYWRSDRLGACLRLLLDAGAELREPALTLVLLDDAAKLAAALRQDAELLTRRVTLTSAFTSLVDVPLLHVAAEYGNAAVAGALIEAGADVNARAEVTADGFNGHTALFHTVNSNGNRSAPVMKLLLDAGADATVRLIGIEWGKGYPWETAFYDVTPVSYAQMGLTRQMHRAEADVYANIRRLMEAAGRPIPAVVNVPNRYLVG